MAEDNTFIAVINDTDPASKGKSYSMKIGGANFNQFLGKKIGDTVDGLFVGEGDVTLSGYTLEIAGGSDKTGTAMRGDLAGGARKPVLVTESTGFKGHKLVHKNSKRYRYKPDGLRMRRVFRGNTVPQDTRQINLKVVKHGNKSLAAVLDNDSTSEE